MSPSDRLLLAAMRQVPFEWGLGRRFVFRRLHRAGAFPITTRIFGRDLRLNGDNISERKFLIQPWIYNRRDFRFLLEAMPPSGGTFVDIGANAGVYAFAVAAGVDIDCRILCIEPNPELAERIESNLLRLNDFQAEGKEIIVDRRAVGDETGEASLAIDRGLGAAGLTPDAAGLPVAVAELATILDDHRIDRVDALKIDIEGLEDRALLPFFATTAEARWPRALIVEHCSRHGWRTDLQQALEQRGYAVRGRTRNNLFFARVDGRR